jgi:hypothetical protein
MSYVSWPIRRTIPLNPTFSHILHTGYIGYSLPGSQEYRFSDSDHGIRIFGYLRRNIHPTNEQDRSQRAETCRS